MHGNQVPRLALDPTLPEPVARHLREHPHLLQRIRAGWTPPPYWPVRVPLLARTAALLLIIATLLILPVAAAGDSGGVDLDSVAAAFSIGLVFAGGFLGVGVAAELLPNLSRMRVNRSLRYAREHPGCFVLPEDLDDWTAPLLRRAQDAADAVLSSQIVRRGLLDNTLNEVRLRDETWRIARRLADLTRVAADYTAIVGERVPAEFAEAYRPYDETLRSSFASLTARVEALEDYAEKVRRADRHFEVFRNLERLREHNEDFERLRADLVDDRLSRPGTKELGAEAEQVERRLRDSVEEARQAAEYLLDSAPEDPGAGPPDADPPAVPAARRPGGLPAGTAGSIAHGGRGGRQNGRENGRANGEGNGRGNGEEDGEEGNVSGDARPEARTTGTGGEGSAATHTA
mgnify:CR=1 FL=1